MTCPDANTLQTLAAGALGEDERAAFFAHADGCSDCRQLLAAVARQEAPALRAEPAAASRDDEPPRQRAVLARGTRVGRYEIEGLVGAGGLGVVHAAHDPELGRRVALKLLRVGGGGQERLVREARALARISHPNVVAVYDVGVWQDRVFVAMELVAGRDLRGWLAAAPRPWREVEDVFLAAGRGLAAAHAAGLVHRDFKPENLLIGDDGRVCVTDFGLARAAEAAAPADAPLPGGPDLLATPLTQEGAVVGTPAYMAPEQHEGGDADARSDQFAFCASLYEALFGRRPFAGETYAVLRGNVVAGRVVPPPRGSSAPRTLQRIVLRGLAPRPADRWPSMEALLAALGRDRTRLPRRLAFGALAVLAVVATALTADWILREREVAVARASFAATRRQIEREVGLRYETFSAFAQLSTMLPILREAAAARDQAAFGLGTAEADARRLEALHASLRDADWDAWAATTRRGAVAVADYKGRLLYTTADPEAFGNDVRRLAAVAAAYRPRAPWGGTQVLRADDADLVASGLAGPTGGQGLVVVFAHASVMAGVPQATFIQTIAGRRLLDELAPGAGVVLGLVAPDGAADGDLASALLEAGRRAPGALVELREGGRPWLVQSHPLPGLQPGAPVATLVMARRVDVGLAGLFPHARALLLALGALAVVLLLGSLFRLRR